jgi:hypothetical protein
MTMKTITLQQLIDLGAPPDTLDKFKKLFGDSVEVTEALCLEYASDFNWDWAADNLLLGEAWEEFVRVKAQAFARLF